MRGSKGENVGSLRENIQIYQSGIVQQLFLFGLNLEKEEVIFISRKTHQNNISNLTRTTCGKESEK